MTDWKKLIADVPDFPKPGIVFKDITPLLADGPGFRKVIDAFSVAFGDSGVTQLAAIESRGFIFGAALAHHLGVGLTLVRKPGKLPRPVYSETYALEYGTDTVQMHSDALTVRDRVIIVDDVLATGGTAAATARLVEQIGAELVGFAFLMELSFLNGRDKLPAGVPIHSLYPLG
ncbi:MAG: adenine phosphoribosyltransferase [Deltaproteobacteria bacterium]|nr:MAG: adenine phosphoribosyltransferase [Deltaproteobacteria bacterium]